MKADNNDDDDDNSSSSSSSSKAPNASPLYLDSALDSLLLNLLQEDKKMPTGQKCGTCKGLLVKVGAQAPHNTRTCKCRKVVEFGGKRGGQAAGTIFGGEVVGVPGGGYVGKKASGGNAVASG